MAETCPSLETIELPVHRAPSSGNGLVAVSGDPTRSRAALYRIPLFHGLPALALDDLARALEHVTFPEGATVLGAGAPSQRLCVIVRGSCKLSLLSPGGRQMTLAVYHAGDVYGETVLLEDSTSPVGVVTMEETAVLCLSKPALLAHVRSHPQTALHLAGLLAARSRDRERRIAGLALDDVEARLVQALATLAMAQGEPCEDGVFVRVRPRQQELAESIGSCRETVSRSMGALARRNMLEIRGHGLLVRKALLTHAAP